MSKAKSLDKGPLLFAFMISEMNNQQREDALQKERMAREYEEEELRCEKNRQKRIRRRKAQFMRNFMNCVFGTAGVFLILILILLFRLII